MLIYLLKFSACLAIFMAFYKICLERTSLHKFKRFFLLGSLVLALAIPALTFKEYVEPLATTSFEMTETITVNEAAEASAKVEINYLPIVLWSIYAIGIIIFLLKFCFNLYKIINRIRKHPHHSSKSFIHVLVANLSMPHTFFSYIFLNKHQFETNTIPAEILIHEQTHARQQHSIDVLIIELLQIAFWFNPLIYLLKRDIKLNHEFLADHAVLQTGTQPSTYQLLVLASSSNAAKSIPIDVGMANAINYSSTHHAKDVIKKRFTVMKTHTSKTKTWLMTLFILPLIALLFYSFAEREYVEKNTDENLFLVTAEIKGNTIELKCESGCRWSQIEIEREGKAQIINDFGFSEGNTLQTDIFTFSVSQIGSEITLKGIKGTIWNNLKFSLAENKKQAFNQFGIADTLEIKEKRKTAHEGKVINIRAVNDKLTINQNASKLDTYKNDFNAYTKDWKRNDFKNAEIDLEIKNCSQDFLNRLDAEFRKTNYFLIKLQGHPETVNQYFENNNSSSYSSQQKATQQQLAEYNHLAKKYNTQPEDQRIIKRKEVERLKILYAIMSENQKATAQSFPDFPPPPPPPPAVTPKNAKDAQEVIEILETPKNFKKDEVKTGFIKINGVPHYFVTIIDNTHYYNRDGYEVNLKGVAVSKTQINASDVVPGRYVTKVYQNDKIVAEFKDNLPEMRTIFENIPPPPPPIAPLDHIIEMAKKGARFYLEDKEITSDKAIAFLKSNKKLNIFTKNSDGNIPEVFLTAHSNPDVIKANKELPKPTAENIVNHIKVMNRHGATFFVEGSIVSYKEALKYVKENRDSDVTTSVKNNTVKIENQ